MQTNLFTTNNNSKLESILENIQNIYNQSIPLCAAETPTSDYVKVPLKSNLQERYIMGGVMKYQEEGNFIGSQHLYDLYEMFKELCNEIFGSKYADARSFSGMNVIQLILMSLSEVGDNILISSSESGGHSSVEKLAIRLGLNCSYIPYDYVSFDYDYNQLNQLIKENDFKIVILAPSDIIYQPRLSEIIYNPQKTHLIYDASQSLGFIASGHHINPLKIQKDCIVIGGTHKTLPGPTNGVILTNNEMVMEKIDTKINPDFIRNVNIHHIISLLRTLIEFETYGYDYMELTKNNVAYLSKVLRKSGFSVLSCEEKISETHQIFISMSYEETKEFYSRCLFYNVSVNKKNKQLFRDSGIRIGLQEISRYKWDEDELDVIAELLQCIRDNNVVRIEDILGKNKFQKKVHFTFL